MSLFNRGLATFVVLAFAAGGSSLMAQRGPAGWGGSGVYGFGPRLGENIGLALEFQEELNLSGEQLAALQELQVGIQTDVAPIEAELQELRNRIMIGEVPRIAGVRQLQDIFSRYEAAAAPYRIGVTTVLLADQHRELQGLMYNSSAGRGTRFGLGRGSSPGFGGAVWRGGGRGFGRAGCRGGGRGFGRFGRGFGLGG